MSIIVHFIKLIHCVAPAGGRAVCNLAAMTHCLLLVMLMQGCGPIIWGTTDRKRQDPGVSVEASPYAGSASYKDTIGSLAYFDGLRHMRVRGYGLVVGLGNNGSSGCPRPVYDKLVQGLYKQYRFASSVVGQKSISPEQLIESKDTAVVVVTGEISAAATKGSTFDVSVMAHPATETKSLRGGRLFTTNLEIFRNVGGNVAITGRTLAKASGPIFLNPFADDKSATRANPLTATILGGGRTILDRRIRLVLTEPSYRWARRIRDRINTHFAGAEKVADAVSPSFITLRVPEGYRDEIGHFLSLLRRLYLSDDAAFEATRARALAEEIVRPNAPHARIALGLEALGRAAFPVLDKLYTHPKAYVGFHAAVAGLRLGDHLAADAMTRIARDPSNQYSFQAIRALAYATDMGSTAGALRGLLEADDPRVRIAAYEALIKRGDPYVHSVPIGDDGFWLDAVPSSKGNLIYSKRSDQRRIAVFGHGSQCAIPVFYRAPDGSFTINAYAEDEMLTLRRTNVATGTSSPPVPGPTEITKLIRLMGNNAGIDLDDNVTGLSLDYGAVVRTLYHLCKDKTVNATFILEQPNAAELFGPPRPAQRPESEF